MSKIPEKPEEIFSEITGDYRKLFGEELISIILYGSGAGEDYIPGKSDLNFLITLTDRGIEEFDCALRVPSAYRVAHCAQVLERCVHALHVCTAEVFPFGSYEYINLT